ncbi:MAG: hypothetical protein IIU39_00730 [Ruminococcus sp.]|jgi:hypothetical protein|nr:hypothetical protein [Ruminococcus sp.]
MLTALTIENVKTDKWYKKLINMIRGNSLNVEIKSARGVVIRDIKYINRNGAVNWFELDREIGAQRNHLLCNDSVIFPEGMGFKRFCNKAFKIQLACNLGIYALSKLKGGLPDIKVGLYDKNAECVNVVEELVNYCKNIFVVTDNTEKYREKSESLTEERGAGIYVSSDRGRLSDCPLVLAPERIEESLPISGAAIVLTGFPPTVCVGGLVYFDYHFRMPNMFDNIKPESLSNEYFAGALFTKGRQYELGSIVPTTCSNFTSSQTPRSICDYLLRMSE